MSDNTFKKIQLLCFANSSLCPLKTYFSSSLTVPQLWDPPPPRFSSPFRLLKQLLSSRFWQNHQQNIFRWNVQLYNPNAHVYIREEKHLRPIAATVSVKFPFASRIKTVAPAHSTASAPTGSSATTPSSHWPVTNRSADKGQRVHY